MPEKVKPFDGFDREAGSFPYRRSPIRCNNVTVLTIYAQPLLRGGGDSAGLRRAGEDQVYCHSGFEIGKSGFLAVHDDLGELRRSHGLGRLVIGDGNVVAGN